MVLKDTARRQELCVQRYSLKKKKNGNNQLLKIKTLCNMENAFDIILNYISQMQTICMQIVSCKWPLPGRDYGKMKTVSSKRGKTQETLLKNIKSNKSAWRAGEGWK